MNVFEALADPTRRAIVGMLAERELSAASGGRRQAGGPHPDQPERHAGIQS